MSWLRRDTHLSEFETKLAALVLAAIDVASFPSMNSLSGI